jgi:dsDNA-specific endonuclease/ATPase MutS2
MQRQKKMEESFLAAHREFMANLDSSIQLVESDINEAKEMQQICTDEWCKATETYLDELAKLVYSISEPRWVKDEDSEKIRNLRRRIHDLYARYKATAV